MESGMAIMSIGVIAYWTHNNGAREGHSFKAVRCREALATNAPWTFSVPTGRESAVAQASGLLVHPNFTLSMRYLCASPPAPDADWKSALQQTRSLRYAEGRRLSLQLPGDAPGHSAQCRSLLGALAALESPSPLPQGQEAWPTPQTAARQWRNSSAVSPRKPKACQKVGGGRSVANTPGSRSRIPPRPRRGRRFLASLQD
jgi:hypothetical protein